MQFACGAVAQLGERVVRNDEVEGSIPFRSTIHVFAYVKDTCAKLHRFAGWHLSNPTRMLTSWSLTHQAMKIWESNYEAGIG